MHQASILMTAFVMIMGGAWYAMKELKAHDAAPSAIEQPVQGGFGGLTNKAPSATA